MGFPVGAPNKPVISRQGLGIWLWGHAFDQAVQALVRRGMNEGVARFHCEAIRVGTALPKIAGQLEYEDAWRVYRAMMWILISDEDGSKAAVDFWLDLSRAEIGGGVFVSGSHVCAAAAGRASRPAADRALPRNRQGDLTFAPNRNIHSMNSSASRAPHFP